MEIINNNSTQQKRISLFLSSDIDKRQFGKIQKPRRYMPGNFT